MKFKRTLRENLEQGDLMRLVNTSLHIDQYKSKMGDDADVCVISFKVNGKEPGNDMVGFIEKGFEYVLDADISSGEKEDGDYLVFVELQRSTDLPEQIMALMKDILNLTEQDICDWHFKYHKDNKKHELCETELARVIVLTPEMYNRKYKKEDQKSLDQMKATAGVEVKTKAPVNEFTDSLRIAAGLK